jgi:hypothetical protein
MGANLGFEHAPTGAPDDVILVDMDTGKTVALVKTVISYRLTIVGSGSPRLFQTREQARIWMEDHLDRIASL